MVTATSISIGQIIASGAQRALDLGELLAMDIPDSKFTCRSQQNMNHAAWVFGHLGQYPATILSLIGRDDLAAVHNHSTWAEWFGFGSVCVADDARLPSGRELVAAWSAATRATITALQEADDSTLLAPQTIERWKERWPVKVQGVNFLMCAHSMFHLGQLSAWRRTMGLPSAMG